MIDTMPWAPVIGRRCRARLAETDSPDYWGRCELRPHGSDTGHALERGMVILRWQSTSWLEEPRYEHERVEP